MTTWTRHVLQRLLIILLVASTAAVVGIPYFLHGRRPGPGPSDVAEAWGWAEADSLPLDSLRVVAALDSALDPELGYSVVELGLVRYVEVDSIRDIRVTLALTTPDCPYFYALGGAVTAVLQRLPGANRVHVGFDRRARWQPDMMSGRARERWEKLFRAGRPHR
jgi:metal-sulfur cluster biosynthetic enzyme